jgi:ribose-phosphate pyrophosphokinase
VSLKESVILGGSSANSIQIASDIAKYLNIPNLELEIDEFPDSEIYVRVPADKVKDKHVIYVQSTSERPQGQNLMELFLTVDALKEKGARMLDLIIPYFAHARQDKEFREGEIVSTRTLGKILKALDVDKLFTVDVHFQREAGPFSFHGLNAYNITATKALATYIKNRLSMRSAVAVIADEGHAPIAKNIEDLISHEKPVILRKKRIDERVVSYEREQFQRLGDIKGKDVVIFDDMISTGGTLIRASQIIKEKGAKKIVIAVTHTLYLNDARKKLLDVVDRIVATDTIPRKDSVVPIAPIISESLKEAT